MSVHTPAESLMTLLMTCLSMRASIVMFTGLTPSFPLSQA